jgi:hypothetical protein
MLIRKQASADKLTEPVEVAKFWKSPRDRSAHVRVGFSEYQGHALTIGKLPELYAALAKALKKAQELQLLADDGAAK